MISLTDELCEILIWIEIPLCITGCFARGFSSCVWGLYLLVYDGVIMECEIRTKCLIQPWRMYWCSTSCICDVNFNYIYPSNRYMLTHWGRVTHICVSKVTIISSDNGLSPGLYQDIIWTNAGILLIGKKLQWNLNRNIYFHSGKSIWKCRLENGGHFVSASMS